MSVWGLEIIASVDVETIADVFVRINGEGKKLNQADFIMTLMSVFWDAGRADLETFSYRATRSSNAEASPFNYFIEPAPDWTCPDLVDTHLCCTSEVDVAL